MAGWRLAGSLVKLREQINARWPNRSKASDGTIGDTAHAATVSDHNPNAAGVVTAFDITHDPVNGVDIDRLSDMLAASRDPRIKYLIANGLILVPADFGWTWQPYSGADPHTNHLHVSVYGDYDNQAEWIIKDKGEDMITKEQYLEGADAVGTVYGKDFNYDPNRNVDELLQFLNGQAPTITREMEHALAGKLTGIKSVIGQNYNSPYVGKKVAIAYPQMVEFWLEQAKAIKDHSTSGPVTELKPGTYVVK